MPHRSSNKAGFSLVEVLISAGLVLLVLGLATSFLIPLLAMQADVSRDIELQQRASLLFEQLRSDIHRSAPAGISLIEEEDSTTLVVHRADDIAQDGTLVWDNQAVIYRWTQANRQLNRLLWTDTHRKILRASSPTRISASQLHQALASVVALTRTFTDVTRFDWSHLGAGATSFTLPLVLDIWFLEESGEVRQTKSVFDTRLPNP